LTSFSQNKKKNNNKKQAKKNKKNSEASGSTNKAKTSCQPGLTHADLCRLSLNWNKFEKVEPEWTTEVKNRTFKTDKE